MSSDPESEASFVEQLTRSSNRDLSILFPILLGIMSPPTPSHSPNPSSGESEEGNQSSQSRIVLINPFTQGMIVLDGGDNVEALLRELEPVKKGPPPASKASIAAMPVVAVANEGEECAVCLEDMAGAGMAGAGEAREMPCKHRYHSNCIEKWLVIHGSCPVCRHQMPVEEDWGKKGEGQDGGSGNEDGGERGRREILVSLSVNRRADRAEDNGGGDRAEADED